MRSVLQRALAVPVWLRPPHWRWNIALELRANPDLALSPLRADRSLHTAASFYRHMCISPEDLAYRQHMYSDMCLAYSLWTGASPTGLGSGLTGAGGWRGTLDSLLLGGLKDGDFSPLLNVDIPPGAMKLYHDVFFDVREYLDSEAAIWINVLSTVEQKLSDHSRHLERNCLLRMFGYTWGPEATLEHFYGRNKGQNEMYGRWVKNLAKDALTQSVAQASMDRRNVYREEYHELLKVAHANWRIPDTEVSTIEAEMRHRFLYETTMLMTHMLRKADMERANRREMKEQALAEVDFGLRPPSTSGAVVADAS